MYWTFFFGVLSPLTQLEGKVSSYTCSLSLHTATWWVIIYTGFCDAVIVLVFAMYTSFSFLRVSIRENRIPNINNTLNSMTYQWDHSIYYNNNRELLLFQPGRMYMLEVKTAGGFDFLQNGILTRWYLIYAPILNIIGYIMPSNLVTLFKKRRKNNANILRFTKFETKTFAKKSGFIILLLYDANDWFFSCQNSEKLRCSWDLYVKGQTCCKKLIFWPLFKKNRSFR